MLNQLRSAAGNFSAKILLVLLVLSFAVWGVGDMITQPSRNRAVATVGGEPITLDTYHRSLQREMETVRRSLGDNYSPEMVKALNIPGQILQRLVQRMLLKLESRQLGVVPGDSDVVRRIRGNPAFHDSKGNFDKNRFNAALRNMGISEAAYVEQLRDDLAANLILDTLIGMTPASETASRALYQARAEERTASLYIIDASLVKNIPAPDAAAIESYYKEHTQEFSAPELRTLSYATFTADEVKKRMTVSESDLAAAYKEREPEFHRPELRTVEQLLYSGEEKAKKAMALIKGGSNFKQVAAETAALNRDNVSLGAIAAGKLPGEADKAVFALSEGGVTAPIKSDFGWHIFRVTAIKPPSLAPFAEVKAMLENDLSQRKADEALNYIANQLEDALAAGSSMQEAAAELKLKTFTLGPVTREGNKPDGTPAKDIPSLDKFLETAFKTDEKTESPLVSAKGGVYYIIHTESVIPERALPLDDVKPRVIAGWQKRERGMHLTRLAGSLESQFSKPESRAAAIATHGLQPTASGALRHNSRTAGGIALPAALVEDIFSRKPGESTGVYPTRNKNGETAYAVAVIKDIIPTAATGKPQALAETRKDLENTVRQELLSQYLRHLAGKYAVTTDGAALEAASQ